MRIFRFEEIDSTNLFLKNMKDKKDYDVVISKKQTAGVGRRGNKWHSDIGGGYFSFALKEEPNIAQEEYGKLSLVVGYSLLKTLENLEKKLNFMFKWTNDIYLENKKLSGILIEKVGDFFIIGIGLNINNKVEDEIDDIGISLKKITNKEYDIEKLIIEIIENFKKDLAFYFNGNFDTILNYLNKKDYLFEKQIAIIFGNKDKINGCAKGISRDGQLIVDVLGNKKLFNIGEIHIEK